MNPILLDLGFIQIRWYSVLILLAFIIGYFLVINRCKKKNIPTSTISDMLFYLIIVCIIGARIYYCLFFVDDLGNNPYFSNLLDIFKIWEGGLAIHGGIISGLIFLAIYTKKKRLDLIEILDIVAPALAIGQCIGRWGNFFNSEAFGSITTLNTLHKLHIPNFIIQGMYINGEYHHPTFLYESIACFIIFIILIILRNKTRKGGTVGIYFILYGIVRFIIESLRTDSLMLFNFKIAQIVSILLIIFGICLIIIPYFRSKNDKQKVGRNIKR